MHRKDWPLSVCDLDALIVWQAARGRLRDSIGAIRVMKLTGFWQWPLLFFRHFFPCCAVFHSGPAGRQPAAQVPIPGSDKMFALTICNELKAFALRDALAPILSCANGPFIIPGAVYHEGYSAGSRRLLLVPEFAELLRGYRRFREHGYPRQKARYDQLVTEGQKPKLMIIGCSDSRVDPAQIFDVDPGQIFVVRNVAALVPPFEATPGQHGVSAALEFAVNFLQVRQIVVMGHGRCGGCQAALTQEMHGRVQGEGGFVGNWVSLLDEARGPIAEEYGTTGREAEKAMELAAVRVSLQNLRTFPKVKEREEAGELVLRGAYFAIADGILHVLDQQTGEFSPA